MTTLKPTSIGIIFLVLCFQFSNIFAQCDSTIVSGNENSELLICKYANILSRLESDYVNNPDGYDLELVAYISSFPINNVHSTIDLDQGGMLYYNLLEIPTSPDGYFNSQDIYEDLIDYYDWGSYLSPWYFLYLGYVLKDPTTNQIAVDSIYGASPVSYYHDAPFATFGNNGYQDCPPVWNLNFKNTVQNHACIALQYPYDFNLYIDDVLQETHTINDEQGDTLITESYAVVSGNKLRLEFINSENDTIIAERIQDSECYSSEACVSGDGEPIQVEICASEIIDIPFNETIFDPTPYIENPYSCYEYGYVQSIEPFLYVGSPSPASNIIDDFSFEYFDGDYSNFSVPQSSLTPHLHEQVKLGFWAHYDIPAGPPGPGDYERRFIHSIPLQFLSNGDLMQLEAGDIEGQCAESFECIDMTPAALGATINLPGVSDGFWTTSGDGTFEGGAIFSSVQQYCPGPNDIASGGTTLSLSSFTTSETDCSLTITDELEFTILATPTIEVGNLECNDNGYLCFDISLTGSPSTTYNIVGSIYSSLTTNDQGQGSYNYCRLFFSSLVEIQAHPRDLPACISPTAIVNTSLATRWYADIDGDGLGDPNNDTLICEQPESFVANSFDLDANVSQFTAGTLNGLCAESTECINMTPEALGATIDLPGATDGFWITAGDGNFEGGAHFSTAQQYCPGPNDVASGGTTLTLSSYPTSEETGSQLFTDELELVILATPSVEVGNLECSGADLCFFVDITEGSPLSTYKIIGTVERELTTNEEGQVATNFCIPSDNLIQIEIQSHPLASPLCHSPLLTESTASIVPTWYADEDGDGLGDPNNFVIACERPLCHVANSDDLDDVGLDLHNSAATDLVTCFPNPNKGSFTLESQSQINVASLRIFDYTGKSVSFHHQYPESRSDSYSFQLQNAAAGIYFMHFEMEEGSTQTVKLIISK